MSTMVDNHLTFPSLAHLPFSFSGYCLKNILRLVLHTILISNLYAFAVACKNIFLKRFCFTSFLLLALNFFFFTDGMTSKLAMLQIETYQAQHTKKYLW